MRSNSKLMMWRVALFNLKMPMLLLLKALSTQKFISLKKKWMLSSSWTLKCEIKFWKLLKGTQEWLWLFRRFLETLPPSHTQNIKKADHLMSLLSLWVNYMSIFRKLIQCKSRMGKWKILACVLHSAVFQYARGWTKGHLSSAQS